MMEDKATELRKETAKETTHKLPPESKKFSNAIARPKNEYEGDIATETRYSTDALNGYSAIRRFGSVTWRNNNPGLLRATGDYDDLKAGGIGTDHVSPGASPSQGYIIFPDWESGDKAFREFVRENSGATIVEVMQLKSKDAITALARLSGLNVNNTKIRDFTPAELDRLINVIYKINGYEVGITTTPEHVQKLPEKIEKKEPKLPEPQETLALRDKSTQAASANAQILAEYGPEHKGVKTIPFVTVATLAQLQLAGLEIPPGTRGLEVVLNGSKRDTRPEHFIHVGDLGLQGEQLKSAQRTLETNFVALINSEAKFQGKPSPFDEPRKGPERDV